MLCAPGHLQKFITAVPEKARGQPVPTASKVMHLGMKESSRDAQQNSLTLCLQETFPNTVLALV